ncbi:MAG: STAS domain-containing protein [Roseiflexaceae bacterium]
MLNTLLFVQARNDDPLIVRRSRSLAILLLILIGISLLLALTLFIAGAFPGPIISGIASLLFLVVYLINRSGRLAFAILLLLIGFCMLQISGAIAAGSPIPAIFFPGLIVVIAAAFGGPRTPLIWAVIVSVLPFVINIVLYGSIVPPSDPIILPRGVSAPPLLALELIQIAIYWMLAGISWLSGSQLNTTIRESRAATQVALTATESLVTQQVDLASRNEQLIQVRQELEVLVAALAVPVVPVADGIGLLPLVGAFDSQRMLAVERQTLEIVSEQRMRALVIDLSGASSMRASDIGGLVRLCAALRLLGVTPVLAGLSPEGALLLSSSDLALPRTVATVQDALSLLQV